MGEQPIFSTKAHIFQIDPETKKKWVPVSSQAANVSFYHDTARNSYRIISLDAGKVLVNSTILYNMTFAKTSQKFGQWADHRLNTIYGLGFNSELDLMQFMEKFNEVKELVKASTVLSSETKVANGTDSIASSTVTKTDQLTRAGGNASNLTQEFNQLTIQPGGGDGHVTPSNTNQAAAVNNQLVEQLKHDNERLKMALAQSSSNAKKWEQDLQTLRNNNTRLTTALQESNTNVEEWKKQLSAYREENTRLKAKLVESEKGGGNVDILQRQLLDYKAKLEDAERLSQRKEDEISELKRKVDELKQNDGIVQKLNVKIQVMEDERLKMRKQQTELQQQVEEAKSVTVANRQQLLAAQQQLSAKINELYEMNDKLADLLQTT